MAIQLIEKHYSFTQPGTQNDSVKVSGTILSGTAVIKGIEPSFPDGEDHDLKELRMRITNVALVNGELQYTLDFFLSDDSGNYGTCNFDVLVVLDVDTKSSLTWSGQSVAFTQPGEAPLKVGFGNTIRSASVALQGFDISYMDGDDHNVETLGVQVTQVNIVDSDTAVDAVVKFDLNDDSGNLGQGSVDVVFFADIGAKSAEAAS